MIATAHTFAASPDLYVPRLATITEVVPMTSTEKFFRLELDRPLGHRPGQFVMASVLGVGEAPISISCGPREDRVLELVIRKAGGLTQVFHTLAVGQSIGIRGPFGSGFHVEELYDHDVLFVCGGLGLVPLRSLVEAVLAERDRFGNVTILSGCRTPAQELYRDESNRWSQFPNVEVIKLVDDPAHLPWDGRVGLVTAPISELTLSPARTVAVLCGPPVMYKFVLLELDARGIPHHQIYLDLERRMRCGVGKCGHCQINHAYCCQDGPVFRFADIAHLPEALR